MVLVVRNGKVVEMNRVQLQQMEMKGQKVQIYRDPNDWGANELDRMQVQMPSLQTGEVGNLLSSVKEEFFPSSMPRQPRRFIRRKR